MFANFITQYHSCNPKKGIARAPESQTKESSATFSINIEVELTIRENL